MTLSHAINIRTLENPGLGQLRVSQDLQRKGILVSASGVRSTIDEATQQFAASPSRHEHAMVRARGTLLTRNHGLIGTRLYGTA
jgi:hypothetical protein